MSALAVLDELHKRDAQYKELQREIKQLRLIEKGWRGEVVDLKKALRDALALIENPKQQIPSRKLILEEIAPDGRSFEAGYQAGLDVALVALAARENTGGRERDLQEGLDQAVEMANDFAAEIAQREDTERLDYHPYRGNRSGICERCGGEMGHSNHQVTNVGRGDTERPETRIDCLVSNPDGKVY